MPCLTSIMKRPLRFASTLAAAIVLCTVGSAYAISFGGPGGTWPKTWPKELEPLRKQAWTWEHGLTGSKSYDIPFASREEFESAWPHILTLKDKGTSITLLRGPKLQVDAGKSAGVRIVPPHGGVSTVTTIWLVVDGEIVDLNRTPLPADTPIIDERFPVETKK